MPIRKVDEKIFEDVIKQNDKIVRFTIKDLDREIAETQARLNMLNARKTAAEAL